MTDWSIHGQVQKVGVVVAGFFEITECSSVHAFKRDKHVRGYTDRNCTDVTVGLRTTFLPLS